MSAHIPFSSVGTTNYERITGHAPHVPHAREFAADHKAADKSRIDMLRKEFSDA